MVSMPSSSFMNPHFLATSSWAILMIGFPFVPLSFSLGLCRSFSGLTAFFMLLSLKSVFLCLGVGNMKDERGSVVSCLNSCHNSCNSCPCFWIASSICWGLIWVPIWHEGGSSGASLYITKCCIMVPSSLTFISL
jgi:hypothetical protein